jgi:hypothetical protein
MVVAVGVVVEGLVCVDVGVFKLWVWAGHGTGGGKGERLRGVVVGGCGGGCLEGGLGWGWWV